MELCGSVKVRSVQQGSAPWKTGTVRLVYHLEKWRIGVRSSTQVQDQYTWLIYHNVDRVFTKSGRFSLFMKTAGESLQMIDIKSGDVHKFVEKVQALNEKKLGPDAIFGQSENQPMEASNKAHQVAAQPTVRVPLSPKQDHMGRMKRSSDCGPSPSSGARKGLSFITNGMHKSAEKLSNMKTNNFYGKRTPELQRSYGAFGVNAKRIKQPGLLPNPRVGQVEKRVGQVEKRTPQEATYDWKPATPTKTDLLGFSNLGNTCYMNATLQCLLNLPTFSEDLMSLFKRARSELNGFPSGYLYVALATLIQAQKAGRCQEKKSACLSAIKNAISTSAKRFSGHEQHDAHEFLGQVLDQLKEEVLKLEKVKAKNLSIKDLNQGIKLTPEGKRDPACSSPQQGVYDNPTVKNFEFTVLHTITCMECGEIVQKEETFHDVSLDMPRRRFCPGERTLQDALDLFFKDEQVEYKCESCQRSNAHVHHKFTKLPRILIMHLKRYNMAAPGLMCGKSGGAISIPRFISLKPHCTDMTSPPFPPDLNTSLDVMEVSKPLDESSPLRKDTPSRRKLEFKGSFQQVPAPPGFDTTHLSGEGSTPHPASSRSRLLQGYCPDAESKNQEEVYLLPEEEPLRSRSSEVDGFGLNPFSEKFCSRTAIAQVDGTMDPRSPTKSSEDEEVDCSDDGMLALAIQASLEDSPPEGQGNPAENQPLQPSVSPVSKDTSHTQGSEGHQSLEVDGQGLSPGGRGAKDCDREETAEKGKDQQSSEEGSSSKVTKLFPIFRKCSTPVSGELSSRFVTEKNPKVYSARRKSEGKRKIASKDASNMDTEDELEEVERKRTPKMRKSSEVLSSPEVTPVKSSSSAPQGTCISEEQLSCGNDPRDSSVLTAARNSTPSKSLSHKPEESTATGETGSSTKSPLTSLSSLVSKPCSLLLTDMRDLHSKRELTAERHIQKDTDFDECAMDDFKLEFEGDVAEGDTIEAEKPDKQQAARLVITEEDDEGRLIIGSHIEMKEHDADKENMTPPMAATPDRQKEGESWSTKPGAEAETEEQEFQRVLQLSLREQEDDEQREKDEIRRATELSLQDLSHAHGQPSQLLDDNDFEDGGHLEASFLFPQEVLDELRQNARSGDLPYSYRLVSVVSHLGSLSNVGHYVCDALDVRRGRWRSYDDTHVSQTSEIDVCKSREQTGYVFFYCAKELIEEMQEFYQHGLDVKTKG